MDENTARAFGDSGIALTGEQMEIIKFIRDYYKYNFFPILNVSKCPSA
jgi:sulfur relay (sulfurtransferase) DsrC/TusE family protein